MPYSDPEQNKAAKRTYYEQNKDRILAAGKKARNERRDLVKQLKDRPCEDCGVKYPPRVMQFHHLMPATKDRKIQRLIQASTPQAILEEVKKCVLLCANCHALRH